MKEDLIILGLLIGIVVVAISIIKKERKRFKNKKQY